MKQKAWITTALVVCAGILCAHAVIVKDKLNTDCKYDFPRAMEYEKISPETVTKKEITGTQLYASDGWGGYRKAGVGCEGLLDTTQGLQRVTWPLGGYWWQKLGLGLGLGSR